MITKRKPNTSKGYNGIPTSNSALQERGKWTKGFRNIQVGQLVIVYEDNTPPQQWLWFVRLQLFQANMVELMVVQFTNWPPFLYHQIFNFTATFFSPGRIFGKSTIYYLELFIF